MDERKESKVYSSVGWLFSVLFHVCLGILLFSIMIHVTPKEPDFVEVTFSQVSAADTPNLSKETTVSPSTPSLQSAMRETRENRLVDVPKRRMNITEPDKIPLDMKEKLQTQTQQSKTAEKIDPLKGIERETKVIKENPVSGARDLTGTQKVDLGQMSRSKIQTEGLNATVAGNKPYEISWEGGNRQVVTEKIPVFPEGIYKEVKLSFKIEVLPDGSIKNILPLQKGEATLESITKTALKQWMFSKLEKSAPQENQYGTIKFRFILR
ncbi:hypothetical protein ACFL7D_06905 [candidate division KSB1 bacterium]